MSSLRYVVVSDLHLGAANSILTSLTPDNRETSPNTASDLLVQFAACLREVASIHEGGQRPTLILNGDILELALAGTNEATMAFRKFFEALTGSGDGAQWPFDRKIYYLPGNHDHHLWNVARERQYRESYLARTRADEPLKPEFQTTNMFCDDSLRPVPCDYLDLAVKPLQAASEVSFLTVYPNFALLNGDKTRCVVFHHGHYIESIYSAMTELKKLFFPAESFPRAIWDLEAENGAWIDFFWSALGRSGQVGRDVELIYDKMQSSPELQKVLARLARSLSEKIPPRQRWSSLLMAPVMSFLLRHVAEPLVVREVHHTDSVLSRDAQGGLARYMEDYVLREITRIRNLSVPANVTFVFGHTHKPFESEGRFKGFPKATLLNSGGWVVDTAAVSPLKGGAVIVVDDDLNVASLRMYNEHDPRDPVRVCVHAAEENPSFHALSRSVDPAAEPWRRFSELADAAIDSHRQNLFFHISACS